MVDPLGGPAPLAPPAAPSSRSGGNPPALRVEGLRKTYEGGFTAVSGLDLEIPDGAFFGLLGPNGAGKTTLIGSVCNIVRPTAGSLSVFGHDHRSRQARRLLGLAAQEINVDRFMRAARHSVVIWPTGTGWYASRRW
ncbi:ATP-binding cassette domain-containing protein [Streptomyces sp. NPDC006476]|uniref:ATP-binding cassette domain-containing protein n=1 Tax=Streptomyces sp. NPDC006476 TaxID=3157175 RepID=UPI00339E8913